MKLKQLRKIIREEIGLDDNPFSNDTYDALAGMDHEDLISILIEKAEEDPTLTVAEFLEWVTRALQ